MLQHDVNWQVPSIDSNIVRRFSEDVTDAKRTSKMARHEIRSLVIDVKKMKIEVEHQTSSVLSVDF